MFFHILARSMQANTLDPISFFKALADETRFLILMLLSTRGELCVCDLIAALNESQPKVSRHLALLRKQQILQDRRQGHWVYYQLHAQLPDWAHKILIDTALSQTAFLAHYIKQLDSARDCCE